MESHEIPQLELLNMPYKEAKQWLIDNGFNVIRVYDVKKFYLENVATLEEAMRFQMFSPYGDNVDEDLKKIYDLFDRTILKESRGSSSCSSTSFNTLNNYLDYRSGCFYKWYQ